MNRSSEFTNQEPQGRPKSIAKTLLQSGVLIMAAQLVSGAVNSVLATPSDTDSPAGIVQKNTTPKLEQWLAKLRMLPRASVRQITPSDNSPNIILPLPAEPGKESKETPITLANAFFIKIGDRLYGVGPGSVAQKIPHLMQGAVGPMVADKTIAIWSYPPPEPEDDSEEAVWYREQMQTAVDGQQIISQEQVAAMQDRKVNVEGLSLDGEKLIQIAGRYQATQDELTSLVGKGIDPALVQNCSVMKTNPLFDGTNLAGSPVYVENPDQKGTRQLIGIVIGQVFLPGSGERVLLFTDPGKLHQRVQDLQRLEKAYEGMDPTKNSLSI